MIKDKLKTISDEDAKEVGLLLLKSHLPYTYTFEKITRYTYDNSHGVDAEESVNVHFYAFVTNEGPFKNAGWRDMRVVVNLIERDRYHDHPYFSAMESDAISLSFQKSKFLANQIEAIEFLQSKGLI